MCSFVGPNKGEESYEKYIHFFKIEVFFGVFHPVSRPFKNYFIVGTSNFTNSFSYSINWNCLKWLLMVNYRIANSSLRLELRCKMYRKSKRKRKRKNKSLTYLIALVNHVNNRTWNGVSIYRAHSPISSWNMSLKCVLKNKPCHVLLKYKCLVKESDHIRPTYHIGYVLHCCGYIDTIIKLMLALHPLIGRHEIKRKKMQDD